MGKDYKSNPYFGLDQGNGEMEDVELGFHKGMILRQKAKKRVDLYEDEDTIVDNTNFSSYNINGDKN